MFCEEPSKVQRMWWSLQFERESTLLKRNKTNLQKVGLIYTKEETQG